MYTCKYPHLFSPIRLGDTVFKNRIPTQREYDRQEANRDLAYLRRLVIAIQQGRASRRQSGLYEKARRHFLKFHHHREADLNAMERQVNATVR